MEEKGVSKNQPVADPKEHILSRILARTRTAANEAILDELRAALDAEKEAIAICDEAVTEKSIIKEKLVTIETKMLSRDVPVMRIKELFVEKTELKKNLSTAEDQEEVYVKAILAPAVARLKEKREAATEMVRIAILAEKKKISEELQSIVTFMGRTLQEFQKAQELIYRELNLPSPRIEPPYSRGSVQPSIDRASMEVRELIDGAHSSAI